MTEAACHEVEKCKASVEVKYALLTQGGTTSPIVPSAHLEIRGILMQWQHQHQGKSNYSSHLAVICRIFELHLLMRAPCPHQSRDHFVWGVDFEYSICEEVEKAMGRIGSLNGKASHPRSPPPDKLTDREGQHDHLPRMWESSTTTHPRSPMERERKKNMFKRVNFY